MCEEMPLGLVPITSDEVVKAIINIFDNSELFIEMSNFTFENKEMKCGVEQTILREFELITS